MRVMILPQGISIFYLCNDAVIAPQFGDKRTDRNTHAILQEQFIDREIIQLNIDGIAAGAAAFTARHSSNLVND